MICIKYTLLLAAMSCVALGDRNPFAYNAPRPSYNPPRPSYNPPRPAYEAPRPTYNAPSRPSYQSDEFEEPKYNFDWQVAEDSNNFDQQESRDGDDTKGSYSVNLPDGRVQTVTYYVDGDSGFVADVSYSGEARYPESREYSAPRPAYQPPRPIYQAPTTQRPVYRAPTTQRPVYRAPTTQRPAYRPPTTQRPAYRPPTTRRPSYSPPRNTYNAPSLLQAYGF